MYYISINCRETRRLRGGWLVSLLAPATDRGVTSNSSAPRSREQVVRSPTQLIVHYINWIDLRCSLASPYRLELCLCTRKRYYFLHDFKSISFRIYEINLWGLLMLYKLRNLVCVLLGRITVHVCRCGLLLPTE